MKSVAILLFFMLAVFDCRSQVTSFEIDKTKLDTALMKTLAGIYREDQSPRLALIALMRLNAGKRATDSLIKVIGEKDSINLIKVKAIISKYGWPGPQTVGINGSQALFLVVQHADLKTQEYYLPFIEDAEKSGKILSSDVAILEDRIAVRKGERQAYGSQGFTDRNTGKQYIYPIADPDNLDKRRAARGLSPMSAYLQSMGLKWNLEEYKKLLPEIEKAAADRARQDGNGH